MARIIWLSLCGWDYQDQGTPSPSTSHSRNNGGPINLHVRVNTFFYNERGGDSANPDGELHRNSVANPSSPTGVQRRGTPTGPGRLGTPSQILQRGGVGGEPRHLGNQPGAPARAIESSAQPMSPCLWQAGSRWRQTLFLAACSPLPSGDSDQAAVLLPGGGTMMGSRWGGSLLPWRRPPSFNSVKTGGQMAIAWI